MFIFFGPLAQFDFLLVEITCPFDIVSTLFESTTFSIEVMTILFLTFIWQVTEYYTEHSFFDDIFDIEPIIVSLVQKKNFDYGDYAIGLFSCIFLCNISGIFPYTGTLTAQLLLTFFLALNVILTLWLSAFFNNRILIFSHFLPNGSPLAITPFIIIIELISNLSRIISLPVRLFANITSGHALLKILAGFAFATLILPRLLIGIISLPILIIFIITLLEILIAFLQAYVFMTLVLIYINEQE